MGHVADHTLYELELGVGLFQVVHRTDVPQVALAYQLMYFFASSLGHLSFSDF